MKTLLRLALLLPVLTRAAPDAEPPLVPRPVSAQLSGPRVPMPPADRITVVASDDLAARHGSESYRLRVAADGVTIESGGPAGAFYARQTLDQLAAGGTLPAGEILDYPRFGWRGFMLDVARHFAPPDQVKQLLDAMAAYKLNVFHWHLSDDQGWRVEIPDFPELTRKGAWRGAGEAVPAWREDHSDARYGGFYTLDELAEIVRYAAERHILVVPEIDVPGHSFAAAAAYPEILCAITDATRSVQGIAGNVWCAGRAENFALLDRVVCRLRAVFPGPYFHIGGDEVNQNAWKNCPRCRARMAERGLTHVGQLQNDFVRRMEQVVRGHDFSMVGWNEILHGGALDTSTVIVAWTGIGPGHEAARRGLRVVMAPGPHCYFDMKEHAQDSFGHWWAGVVSLPKVYAFDPLAGGGLDTAQQSRILGVQAALWTEFITEPARQDQKIWPRLCALAEVGWTPQGRRDFTNFMARLGPHFARLAARGIAYRMPEATARLEQGRVVVAPPHPGADVRYTLDGTEPGPASARWTGGPLNVPQPKDLRLRAVGPGDRWSLVSKGVSRPASARDGALKFAAAVTTTMPVYGPHAPANLADGDAKTFFWSSAHGRAGQTLTITFAEPVRAATVELPTGKLDDPTADLVVDGRLEISEDGTTFTRVAGFEYGTARADVAGRQLKALRLVLNADHDTWIVVQDPLLRP